MGKFNRKQQITLPGYSFKEREVGFIKSLGQMTRSDRVGRAEDDRKRATVMKILNLEDGLLYRMICPSLLISALEDEDVDYVGRCFEICVTADVMPGKDYKGVEVFEIECPESADNAKPEKQKGGKGSEEKGKS